MGGECKILICILRLEMNEKKYIYVHGSWNEWKNICLCAWILKMNEIMNVYWKHAIYRKGDECPRATRRILSKMAKTMNMGWMFFESLRRCLSIYTLQLEMNERMYDMYIKLEMNDERMHIWVHECSFEICYLRKEGWMSKGGKKNTSQNGKN